MKTSIHLRDIVQYVPGLVSYSGVDRLITCLLYTSDAADDEYNVLVWGGGG